MVIRRRSPWFVLSCLVALALSGCADSDNDVTVSPTPTPTPPAVGQFTITGRVFEAPPTTSEGIPLVQVALSGGSTTANTDGDGTFTLTGVAAGTYTLTFSKADYVTQTRPVVVANASITGLEVTLAPTPRTVREEFNATIRGDGPPCFGTSKACHVYKTGAHHDGEVEVFMTWTDPAANFNLELRCNGEVVDESLEKEPLLFEMRTPVKGGQACELHVIFTGHQVDYGIFLSYPY